MTPKHSNSKPTDSRTSLSAGSEPKEETERAEAVEPNEGSEQTQHKGAADTATHFFDRKMLEVLVCPLTKSMLEYDPQRQELISKQAGLAFPIRSGVPIMLPDEARVLEE